MVKSRFRQEWDGDLGDFWRDSAERDVARLIKQAENGEMIIEDDGAVKWKNSGNYVPEDICEMLEVGEVIKFSPEATRIKRDEQDAKDIAEYRERMKNHVYSDEELFEMRAAFGSGTKVVNVITRQEIEL